MQSQQIRRRLDLVSAAEPGKLPWTTKDRLAGLAPPEDGVLDLT
jgi:hypothetical protein